MKKIVSMVAGVALAGLVASAADPVYSVNAVGYVTKSLPANGIALFGAPFAKVGQNNARLTVQDVLGITGIPDTTIVYIFNGTDYQPEYFFAPDTWVPGTNLLSRVDGFWVSTPEAATFQLTGEVPSALYATNTTSVIASGFQIISYPYPATVAVTNTMLNTRAVAGDGDIIYAWNGSDYNPYYYGIAGDTWYPDGLTFQPGVGYWYYREAAGSVVWSETKPYNWP